MGLRKRKPGAVGGVLQGRARQRSIEIRRKTGIQRKWQSRLVLWPESPTARVRLTRSQRAFSADLADMGLRKRKPGAVGGVLQGRARQRSIEIRRKTGIQRKWQSRLVLWP